MRTNLLMCGRCRRWSGPWGRSGPRGRRAFTLIELLTVVSIIGILVALLLPALRGARGVALTAVCAARMKEIGKACHVYANANKDQIWEAASTQGMDGNPDRWWWCAPRVQDAPLSAANPYVIGPGLALLDTANKVLECPANKRQAPVGPSSGPSDLQSQVLFQQFLDERVLNFDYTMATGASGAPLSTTSLVAYDPRCATRFPGDGRAPSVPVLVQPSPLVSYQGPIVFAEEDTTFNNASVADGLWSNSDQLTTRHANKGNMLFLDDSVALEDMPKGRDAGVADQGDFTANDVYAASAAGRFWYQYAPTWPGVARKYGWLKSPKP